MPPIEPPTADFRYVRRSSGIRSLSVMQITSAARAAAATLAARRGCAISPTATVVGGSAPVSTSRETGAYAAAVREIWRPADMQPDSLSVLHREVIRCATLAPSNRNAQPWKLRLASESLLIHPDFMRRVPAADPDDEFLFIGLGCAAENAGIAARAFGLRGEITYHPAGRGGLKVDLSRATHIAPSALFHAIARRQSTRGPYDGRLPSLRELGILERCAKDLDVQIHLVTDPAKIERLAELVYAADTIRMSDPALMVELKQWMRFSERSALRERDGLFTRCERDRTALRWLGTSVGDRMTSAHARREQHLRDVRTAGGFAVLIGAGRDPRHWATVGRACERLLLDATALNVRVEIVNEPIEVRATRAALGAELDSHSRLPDVLIRFGYGPLGIRSLRRSISEVML